MKRPTVTNSKGGKANGQTNGHLRCAIYTRKSSEEGLEQDFNSLHAQREACEAYVLSQKHEGWALLPAHYDDGGFSGGSIERPALKRLLDDIAADIIDVVVVYKVDRLTRSLADFAKIVEVFDGQAVCFVSVTQQFNTTTSMGRLTLNMLLSFAQFEREVTGERIRDKIAASKKKGMWMGGFVPLGYEPKERSLVVNESEAQTVRTLFALYLDLGNVRLVKDEADRLELRSKRHGNGNGRLYGGARFSRGAIYKILSNPIYVGEIVHKGERYPGSHPAIIDLKTWDEAQRRLASNAARQKEQAAAQSPSMLAGLIFEEAGEPLTPTHANKNGRRYRYYISRALLEGRGSQEGKGEGGSKAASSWRLPAGEIETLIVSSICTILSDRARLIERLGLAALDTPWLHRVLATARERGEELAAAADPDKRTMLRKVLRRVEVGQAAVMLQLDRRELADLIDGAESHAPRLDASPLVMAIPIRLKRRGSELKLVIADCEQPSHRDRSLITALACGFGWHEEIRTGAVASLGAIAEREKVSPNLVRRYLDIALSPTDLIEAILAGQQPIELTSESFKKAYPLPIAWDDQKRALRLS